MLARAGRLRRSRSAARAVERLGDAVRRRPRSLGVYLFVMVPLFVAHDRASSSGSAAASSAWSPQQLPRLRAGRLDRAERGPAAVQPGRADGAGGARCASVSGAAAAKAVTELPDGGHRAGVPAATGSPRVRSVRRPGTGTTSGSPRSVAGAGQRGDAGRPGGAHRGLAAAAAAPGLGPAGRRPACGRRMERPARRPASAGPAARPARRRAGHRGQPAAHRSNRRAADAAARPAAESITRRRRAVATVTVRAHVLVPAAAGLERARSASWLA